jgi:hypothetical protein
MSDVTSHSIRDLRKLYEALRAAATDAIAALGGQTGDTDDQAFIDANGRALMLAREIAAVQDAEQK